MRIQAVIGNPKAPSKTSTVGAHVAGLIASIAPDDAEVDVLELADLGPKLLGWGDPDVTNALQRVYSADALVIASPTFKASFTGLLKLFLDQIPAGGLKGTLTVPLMLAGSPMHTLGVETQLRPVLVEIGAAMPTSGVYVIDTQVDDLDTALASWWANAGPLIERFLR